MYLKVEIRDKQFTISGKSEKYQEHGLALATLSRIEEILQSHLSGPLTSRQLQQAAHKIQSRYLEKTSHLSWFRRFFGSVSAQEHAIITICSRIERLVNSRPVLPLPDDAIATVFSFLSARDLGRIASTSIDGAAQSTKAMIALAKKHGFKGEDSQLARKYLSSKFHKPKPKPQIITYTYNYYPHYQDSDSDDNSPSFLVSFLDAYETCARVPSSYPLSALL